MVIEKVQVQSTAGHIWTFVLVNGRVDSCFPEAKMANARIDSLKAGIQPNVRR